MFRPNSILRAVAATVITLAAAQEALVTFGGIAATEAAPDSTQRPSVTDGFAAKIEVALGIADTGADILPSLEQAIKKLDASPGESAAAIGQLVAMTMKGPHPSVLLDKLLPLAEIGGANPPPFNRPEWKWGSPTDMFHLVDTTWKLATGLQKKDPTRASEFAKAAILLSALEDFDASWVGMSIIDKSPDDSKPLLAIPDGQFQILETLLKQRTAAQKERGHENLQAFLLIDAMTSSKGAIAVDDVKNVLLHFNSAFHKGPAQLGYRWGTISGTWSLLNLAKSRKNVECETAVRAQLQAWKTDFPDENIARWVDQSLSRDGPPPGALVQVQKIGPDGKSSIVQPNDPEFPKIINGLQEGKHK